MQEQIGEKGKPFFPFIFALGFLGSGLGFGIGTVLVGEVTHALMRKHNHYHPGYPGAHLCPTKSMAETNGPIGT